MIGKGADVDARNCKKDTPLHLAAINGNCEIAKYLIKSGANIKAMNNK